MIWSDYPSPCWNIYHTCPFATQNLPVLSVNIPAPWFPWFAYIWLVYLVKDTRHFWKISKFSMAMFNNHIGPYSYIMDFPWLCYIFGSRFPKPQHLPGRPGEGHPGAPGDHHRTPPFPKRKDPGLGPKAVATKVLWKGKLVGSPYLVGGFNLLYTVNNG